MLSTLKRSDASSYILLLLLIVAIKLHLFIHPPRWSVLEGMQEATLFNWKWMRAFYLHSPRSWLLISTILQLVFAWYMNLTLVKHKLFQQKSLLPVLILMGYSAMIPSANVLTMPFLSGIFGFIAFAKSMDLYQVQDSRGTVYTVGWLASLAAIFYFPAIVFFLLFLIIILILRSANLRDIVTFVLGYLTPVYFAWGITYLVSNQTSRQVWNIQLALPVQVSNFLYFGTISFLSLMYFVYALYLNSNAGYRIPIGVKKKWNTVFWYFSIAALSGVWAIVFPSFTWVIAVIPFSIILCQCFLNNQEKYNTFAFYLFLLAVFGIQWFLIQ